MICCDLLSSKDDKPCVWVREWQIVLSLDFHDTKQLDPFYWTNAKVAIKSTHTQHQQILRRFATEFWIITFLMLSLLFSVARGEKNWRDIISVLRPFCKLQKQIAKIHSWREHMLSGNLQFRRHRLSLQLLSKFSMRTLTFWWHLIRTPRKKLLLSDQTLCVVSFCVQNLAFKNAGCCKQQQEKTFAANNRTIKIPNWTKRRLTEWNNQARKKRKKIDGKHFIIAKSILSLLSLYRWCISHNRMWHGDIIDWCVLHCCQSVVLWSINLMQFPFLGCSFLPEIGCDDANSFLPIKSIVEHHPQGSPKWRCVEKSFCFEDYWHPSKLWHQNLMLLFSSSFFGAGR